MFRLINRFRKKIQRVLLVTVLSPLYWIAAKLSWCCISSTHLSPRAQQFYRQFKAARYRMQH